MLHQEISTVNCCNYFESKNGSSDSDRPKEIRGKGIRCYITLRFRYFQLLQSGNFRFQAFKKSIQQGRTLRYGENPHQKGTYFGDLDGLFEQLNGKELSYNNLVDVDAAVNLVQEFAAKHLLLS